MHGRYVLGCAVLLEDYVEQVGHGSFGGVGDFICKCCRVVVTHDGTVDGQGRDDCTRLHNAEESAVRLEVVDGKATAVERAVVARLADGSQLDAAHVDVVRQHGLGICLAAIHDLSKAVEVGSVLNLICAVHELGSRGIVVHISFAKQIYLAVSRVEHGIFVCAQRLEPYCVLRLVAVEQIAELAGSSLGCHIGVGVAVGQGSNVTLSKFTFESTPAVNQRALMCLAGNTAALFMAGLYVESALCVDVH